MEGNTQQNHDELPLLVRFENRALKLRREAYGFLVIIVGLLVFGGFVTYQAAQITTRDIGEGLMKEWQVKKPKSRNWGIESIR
jgi:hypothetical protein